MTQIVLGVHAREVEIQEEIIFSSQIFFFPCVPLEVRRFFSD